jgi:hypothetical protein
MWELSHHCIKWHQHANHSVGGPALGRNQLQQPTNRNAGSPALAGINISPIPPTGMTHSINVHLRSTSGRHGRWDRATMRSARPPRGHHSSLAVLTCSLRKATVATTRAIIGTPPSQHSKEGEHGTPAALHFPQQQAANNYKLYITNQDPVYLTKALNKSWWFLPPHIKL